ncbi:MAG TPA: hypothetical protein PKA53_06630 [Sphingobacterium sp.]|nr:hypothetical protein [Sphingobacterium sp.]
MRYLSFILCGLLIATCFTSGTPQNINVKKVYKELRIESLKLNAHGTKILRKVNTESFVLSREGVLRPSPGFKIVYVKELNLLVLCSIKRIVDLSVRDGSQDIGGGYSLNCTSSEECIECQPVLNRDRNSWSCSQANCFCWGEVILSECDVNEFVTASGTFNGNDLCHH